jgi:hypothetical protein
LLFDVGPRPRKADRERLGGFGNVAGVARTVRAIFKAIASETFDEGKGGRKDRYIHTYKAGFVGRITTYDATGLNDE